MKAINVSFLQMCGIGSIDVKDWKQNTVYKGDYHPNHIVIQWFWRVVLSFNNELRSRLLQVGVKISVIESQPVSILISRAPAVRDGDVARADERVQGAVREQRAAAVHHREVGQPEQLPQGAHLLQQARPAPLRELPAAQGAAHQVRERRMLLNVT